MIKDVRVYSVYNSKGEHALRVKIQTTNGFFTATIPSGTSKGKNEAKDISMEKILEIFPKIRKNIIGLDETDWITADEIIEQTENSKDYRHMGISLALGLSIAIAKAATNNELWRLRGTKERFNFPYPVGNVIGGGKHGGKTTWQEFLSIPYKAKSPMEATHINYEFWKVVGEELQKNGWLIGRNIENAWTSKLDDLKTLDVLSTIAEDFDVKLGVDFAASSFWNGKFYVYKSLKKKLDRDKQIDAITRVAEVYDLYYIEDPLHEDDFEGFAELTKRLHNRLVIGDDIYSTNPERIAKGIRLKSTNGVVIKPNQYGTLLQVSKAVKLVRESGMFPIVSHRSCETEDDWLADLALAWNAPLIKIGNLGLDIPKHSRLAELWEDIPNKKMAFLPFIALETMQTKKGMDKEDIEASLKEGT
ncbi:MAG: enolase C-terminal domain-like protein [Candidatus Aenigmatarchaeota archaeon]